MGAGALAFASPAFASHGPDVNGAAKAGLCHACSSGSLQGRTHKHKHSRAFKRLAAAAAAHSETVAAFCADATLGHDATETARQGPPTSVPNRPSVTSEPATPHVAAPNHPGGSARSDPPTSVGGTNVANGNSHDGASEHGTTAAATASDGHSAKGSDNAGGHRP